MAASTHGLIADFRLVIADFCLVIADSCLVIADSIRNPVFARHWIPDQVRDDRCQVRDDSGQVRDDRLRN